MAKKKPDKKLAPKFRKGRRNVGKSSTTAKKDNKKSKNHSQIVNVNVSSSGSGGSGGAIPNAIPTFFPNTYQQPIFTPAPEPVKGTLSEIVKPIENKLFETSTQTEGVSATLPTKKRKSFLPKRLPMTKRLPRTKDKLGYESEESDTSPFFMPPDYSYKLPEPNTPPIPTPAIQSPILNRRVRVNNPTFNPDQYNENPISVSIDRPIPPEPTDGRSRFFNRTTWRWNLTPNKRE